MYKNLNKIKKAIQLGLPIIVYKGSSSPSQRWEKTSLFCRQNGRYTLQAEYTHRTNFSFHDPCVGFVEGRSWIEGAVFPEYRCYVEIGYSDWNGQYVELVMDGKTELSLLENNMYTPAEKKEFDLILEIIKKEV